MIEFYTEDAWLSYFSHYSSLIIDDDGFIYNGDDYRQKHIKDPLGKLDYSTGEIYGSDFYKYIKDPIGYLKKCGEMIEVYDKSYREKMIHYPAGYICDGKYYSYEEYHKLMPSPQGYFDGEVRVGSSGGSVSTPSYMEKSKSDSSKSPADSADGAFGFGAAILILLSILSVITWIKWLWSPELMIICLIGVTIGSVIAVCTTEKFGIACLVVIASSVFIGWAIVIIGGLIETGITLEWIFAVLVAWIVLIPLCAFPGVICAIILTAIKKIIHRS